MGRKRMTHEDFLRLARDVHGNQFKYLGVYVKWDIIMIIICRKHNIIYSQTPRSHLAGGGCPVCTKEKRGAKRNWPKTSIDTGETFFSSKDLWDFYDLFLYIRIHAGELCSSRFERLIILALTKLE